jgi:hypothetical protein
MATNRRTFLQAITCTAVQARFGMSEAVAQDDRAAARDAWMHEWMIREKDVKGKLHLSRFADPMYFLLESITWIPNSDQSGYPMVTVPTGFVTDFASIPRVFYSLFRPDGRYTYPAIVHDYLYWTQSTSKDVSDEIFSFGMRDFGVGTITITTLYQAVVRFGQSAWDGNRRLKAAGEKRILIMQPDDPRILWTDWKKDPSHFIKGNQQ